jgi:hypothetical protein
MKRTISSAIQSAFKMLSLFFCGMFAIAAFTSALTTGRVPWGFLLLIGGVLALFLWFAVSRKTVQMDDRFLYVSVFRRAAQIPLDQVASVTESIGMRDRAVTIHFRDETPYGRAITFTPTVMFGRESHPIVAELSSYAARDAKPKP